ncbi:two-component sensor histidine kinase [Pseudarthrobacter phenanthrenivorans]|uniref:Sensor-like histidine kinase SenX3 n=2 Tax=Pseudarthrobacter phenanthrenivorans TaxID=361575 RepID=A0A3B0FX82_PSEPS|nr:ATP-binding protein [Pseudarthrobacter phenanthrenivorans]ADX71965.1 histidine kinase [Pseudarthrobacter phenanthrenivorans Sphe3]RKO24445.1 two-component sensor histidine kinase [Pseudarthrobacter phenanthrenivorans]
MLIGLVAGLIGLALGTFGVLAYRVSEKQRQLLDVDAEEIALPAGAAEVLAVVGRAFVVVDAVDGVVRASPAAYAYGLVRGHTVVHKELLDMTAGVRRDGVILEKRLELPRGPLGQGTIIVQVRAAMLGEEYILLLADDRTEITRTEEIRNDFVANVSHELKTPVGAISLLAEALESSADDELAVRRFAKRMHKESGRLAALVQDIIELSRLQGASVIQQGGPVDVNAVIAEAVDRSQLPAESKNIRIIVGGRTEAKVFGDQDLLVTALRNLIDNAIRYSPENTRVGIGVRSRDGLVSISVTDQGEGLSPEDQERVFERFYRVDAARSRHTGGTGLGLSIVKHVASNHGGEVTLWSQPGQGSTFTLRLPEMEGQEAGEEATPAATPAAGTARQASGKPPVTPVPRAAGATERGANA